MEDKYKRLTASQVELWLDNPVTKHHLLCLQNQIKDVEDEANSGAYVDRSNNDLTCNNIQYAEGRKAGYRVSADPVALLEHYRMIEEETHDEAA